MAAEVKTLTTSQKEKKKTLIKRITGKQSAHTSTPTKKAGAIAFDIAQAMAKTPDKTDDVPPFCQAICSIENTKMTLDEMLAATKGCYDLANSAGDNNALSYVFKAACRIDEIFFKAA